MGDGVGLQSFWSCEASVADGADVGTVEVDGIVDLEFVSIHEYRATLIAF